MASEIVTVHSTTVCCEGNSPVTGHPKVYLTFKPGNRETVCPYCSRTFVLAEGVESGHDH
jgi:uncharacterized Zn-finger protein